MRERHMLRRRPALRFALLFAAGILLASRISIAAPWIFLLSASLLFVCLILDLTGKQRSASVSLQCCVITLGFLLQTLQRLDFQSRELEPAHPNESVILYGIVESEPARQDLKITCVVACDSIIGSRETDRTARRVMVIVYLKAGETPSEILSYGKKVEITGFLDPFPFQRNPGEFDYAKYLALNDIEGMVTVKDQREVCSNGLGDTRSFRASLNSVQHALYRIIDGLHAPDHASFLKGIIFGYRGEIPADVKQSFIDTGTIHILAVSGSNVAFVAFVLFSILGFFRLSRKSIGVLTMAGLLAYMLITGSSPSVVRATIMAIVILCGTMLERKADIYNSISVAALLLLFWNTNNLFDTGFQLSFAAVISIVYFYPRLELLIRKIPERFEEIKMIDAVLKLFAVSLAAQLGTIPFVAYYFSRISVVSLLANIVVVPLSGLSTFIGAAEILFSFLHHGIAQLYAAANDFVVWFLLGFVKQAAGVSFAYLEAWQLSSVAVCAYYLVILGVFNSRRPRILPLMIILSLMLANGMIFADIWTATGPVFRVSFIDVGQGDAILLESPNGRRVLIDAGPSSRRFDAGARTVMPFLKRKGIARLEYFLLTHPHGDHIGGASSILLSLHVDTLLVASQLAGNSQMNHVFETARMANVPVNNLSKGSQIPIGDDLRLYVLHPGPGTMRDRILNNSSVVLRAVYGGSSILLVGDAESTVERTMVASYGGFLASDALKAGHHGSASSSSESFLNAVHPRTAIISVGTHNVFGHPSPRTITALARHSIEVFRMDKSGAIVLESDGTHWERKDWR